MKYIFWICWIMAGIILININQNQKETSELPNQDEPSRRIRAAGSFGKCAEAVFKTRELLTEEQISKVHNLIDTHPSEEIRKMLLGKLKNGDVCLGRRIHGTDNALFKPILANSYIPFIFIRNKILKPGKELYAQLIIYHEYIHYKQWLSGMIDNEEHDKSAVANMDPHDRMEVCKKIWHAENEAYQKECELAQEIGAAKLFKFCSDGHNHTERSSIASHVIEVHDWSVTCKVEWDTLASHASE